MRSEEKFINSLVYSFLGRAFSFFQSLARPNDFLVQLPRKRWRRDRLTIEIEWKLIFMVKASVTRRLSFELDSGIAICWGRMLRLGQVVVMWFKFCVLYLFIKCYLVLVNNFSTKHLGLTLKAKNHCLRQSIIC